MANCPKTSQTVAFSVAENLSKRWQNLKKMTKGRFSFLTGIASKTTSRASFPSKFHQSLHQGRSDGGIPVYIPPPPNQSTLNFFMWLFGLPVSPWPIYTHPNQIPGYASLVCIIQTGNSVKSVKTTMTDRVHRVTSARQIITWLLNHYHAHTCTLLGLSFTCMYTIRPIIHMHVHY